MLSSATKARIYGRGLQVGLPYAILKKAVDAYDASCRPVDWTRRRRVAREVVAGSKWSGFLPRDTGLATFAPGEIPGLKGIEDLGLKIYNDRKAQVISESRGRSDSNPFYVVLNNDDLGEYPELVEAALSPSVTEILCDYFGAVPRLHYINIWMVRADNKTYGSQLFHLDKPDMHFVSVFVNLFDCQPQNGPTTVLPANLSAPARKSSNYDYVYYHKGGYLSDEEMLRHCNEADLATLPVEAGAGGICDTSTCLHYGSRCRMGERGTLVFRYAKAHKALSSPPMPRPARMDPVRELFLGNG